MTRRKLLLFLLMALFVVSCAIFVGCGGNTPETPNTYTVKFLDINKNLIGVRIGESESLVYEQKVKEGESAIAPTAPVVAGFVFERWDADFTSVKSDLTINSVYSEIQPDPTQSYSVKFVDYDRTPIGVQIGDAFVYEQFVKSGESATAPVSPSREGYVFKGWNKDYTSVTSDLEIQAQYTQVCEVIFWSDNEVYEVRMVEYGKDAELPLTDPVKVGHRFDHWEGKYQNVIANTNVNAVFVKQYVVTFKGYNGVELKVETVDEHGAATAPVAPQVAGYVFKNWDVSFEDVTSDLTVNAVYQEASSFDVTFVDHDDTVLKTERVYKNTGATAPDMTGRNVYVDFDLQEKQGYMFTGWDKDFSCVTTDLTVYAQYVEIDEPILYVKPEVVTKGSGNYVTVSVYVVSNTSFSGLNIKISYANALDLIESNISVKGIFNTQDRYDLELDAIEREIDFSWMYPSGEYTLIDNYSKVLELKFEIDDYIAVGEYAVNISNESYYVKNYITDTPVIISGCVSVEEA